MKNQTNLFKKDGNALLKTRLLFLALDQVITLTTKEKFSTSRTYYVRIGARIDFHMRYNYNEPKTVKVL